MSKTAGDAQGKGAHDDGTHDDQAGETHDGHDNGTHDGHAGEGDTFGGQNHAHGGHAHEGHTHTHEGHTHTHGRHTDNHAHAAAGDLRVAFGINVLFTLIELVGGLWTNSVAIISDAVHDLGDSVSLGIALILERIAGRGRTQQLTFGYRRFSTLGALFTGVVLIVGAITVLIHAVPRLFDPQPVDSEGMIILAVVGVAMNALAALRLSRTESMNAKAAFLHLLEDVLGWVAVLLGAIAIRIWNITWLDPLLSVGINIFVLSRAVPIILRTFRVFLQFTPQELSVADVEREVAAVPGVADVHDIHLWSLDGNYALFSGHIVTTGEDRPLSDLEEVKTAVRERLRELGVAHATLELESPEAGCRDCDL